MHLITPHLIQTQTANAVSPKPPLRKHLTSSSLPPLVPPSKRSRYSPRGPAVVEEVANAIRELSKSMSNNTAIPSVPSTPKRRQAAIEGVEKDATFSTPEQIRVWSLFYNDIAATDTFMAISDKRKRNRFVRQLLDMPADELDNPFL